MKPWTNHEQDRLREMLAEGVLLVDIARKLDRTKPSIQAKAQALRLRSARRPGRPPGQIHLTSWTNHEQTRLRELIANGLTVAQAAAELGRTLYATSARMRRLGIRSVHRRGRPPGRKKPPIAKMTVWASEETSILVRARAAKEGMSVSSFLKRAIERELDRSA